MLYMLMDFEPGGAYMSAYLPYPGTDQLVFCLIGELFSIIQKNGTLSPTAAQTVAAAITLVFEFCHSKNVIYRDLKPENILIDAMGHAKLTDFGLSKQLPEDQGRTWTLAGSEIRSVLL